MIHQLVQLFFLLFNFYMLTLSLSPDGLSLLSLKSAVDNSSALSDWNEEDETPCKWTGVSCMNVSGSSDPRVIGLSLAGKNLRGYIPSELGTLVYLRRINLHDNNFNGPIPIQLFNATALHSIFLYGNNLSGSLPPSICSIPRLQNLDLSHNRLHDVLPNALRNCKHLQRLILAHNQFTGSLPTGIWSSMENLAQLDLSDNEFVGEIPVDIGELRSLSGTLNLSFNHFSGGIPKSLGNLPLAVSFDLQGNNLSGEIPLTGTFVNQGPTAFLNNPLLCGFPLQKKCKNSQETPSGIQRLTPSIERPKKGLKPSLIVLISVADAAGIALIGLIAVYVYWRRNDSGGCSCTGTKKLGGGNERRGWHLCLCPNSAGSEEESDAEGGGRLGGGEGELVAIDKRFTFELDELLRASAYVLGKSGFGIVYKVVLANGTPVAVRRLGEGGEQRYREFTTEIQAIARVNHPNIVRLRAYYWASDEKLLVSDYISNGSLTSAFQGKNGDRSSSFSWSVRLKIAKGAARGLAYLHECSPRKFVHGDIKPSNILLSHDFQPHISDFGLNRLISITGNNPASSGGFIGPALPYLKTVQTDNKPNNYRAPEARIFGSKPTQKWDVYSFGIILLELLTGRSPDHTPTASTSSSEIITDLVRWVRNRFEKENNPLSEMIDPVLLQEMHANKKEMVAVFQIALACTELDPELRPRLKTVSDNLGMIGS